MQRNRHQRHRGRAKCAGGWRSRAGQCDGNCYPFDLSNWRPLDTALANACLDTLNYDRLGVCDLDRHLADGGAEVEVEGWIRDYGYIPRASEG
jgi:hypothetical protein